MFKKALVISLITCLVVTSFVGCKKDDKKNSPTTTPKNSSTISKSTDLKVSPTISSANTPSASPTGTSTITTTTGVAPTAYAGETFAITDLVLDSTTNATMLFFNLTVDSNIIDPAGNASWIPIATDSAAWKAIAEKVSLNGVLKLSDIESLKLWYMEGNSTVSMWIPVGKYTFKEGDTAVFDADFGTYDGKILGEKITWSFDGSMWSQN